MVLFRFFVKDIMGLRISIHHLLDFLLSAELLLFYCMTGLIIYYTKE